MVKKGCKKGCKLGGHANELTQSQKEILHYLTQEFLTPQQIAIRRGISHQAIYQTINKLKKLGILSRTFNVVAKNRGTIQPSATLNHQIRLHAQEWNIKLLHADQFYKKKIGKLLFIDDNTIKCYRNSIEIYSGKSFFADTAQKATVRSIEYWNRFFSRVEHDLKIIIVKPRYQNITLVNQHYSEINNELAQECKIKAEKIRVYTQDDGKLWFTIDNSFNFHEAETQHPQTAKEDMQEVIAPFFNGLRDDPVTWIDIKKHFVDIQQGISILIQCQQVTQQQLQAIITMLQSPMAQPEQPIERPYYVG